MEYKILITAPYMYKEKEKIEKMLKEYPFDAEWFPVQERLEEEDLLPIISQYDGIICGDDKITKKVIDSAKKLKAIVKWGTGIDSINKEYAESKGIKVCRTPDAFTEPVSDSTIGFMLNEVRGIAKNNKVIKSGEWDKPQGYTLGEKIIGIIGFGNIGQAVARKLMPFQTTVLVNDIKDLDPKIFVELNVKHVSKEEIYERADIITLHTDLNPTSRYLLSAESFAKMKKRPYIVNTARGPLIKEEDLVLAIKKGLISGAGIDVFEHEPLSMDSPLRFLEGITASCHNSNSSPACWQMVHENSLQMLADSLKQLHR